MEAAAARGGSLSITSSRKEWRAVSEHQSARNSADEDLERSKLGQSDEKTIYEVQQGREPADVDFCSITVDGSSDSDILQQRLHNVARQREELQQLEVELRAQVIARSEIMEMQNSFDTQLNEHASALAKLQEQIREKEQIIRNCERKMEETERELHAIKLDNEAAWAKDDLLREQNKELATYRRERDHSEAERAQHLKQIHDLQEHIQEKERQLIDLQEQNRVAQDTILFKEDQLREAHSWVARLQQMEALQSHELRERTEQFNQLWHGCQRQFAEIERLHLQLQQLQLELDNARGRNGAYVDESCISQGNSNETSQFGQNSGNPVDANTGSASAGSTGILMNGSSSDISSLNATGNVQNQNDHVPNIPLVPSSLLGVPPYIPPGQVTALHRFVMQQQGVQSGPPQVPQSDVGNFDSVAAHSSLPQWQNQQVLESSQISTQNQLPQSKTDLSQQMSSDVDFNFETSSAKGQSMHPDYLDVHINQRVDDVAAKSSSTSQAEGIESTDRSFEVSSQSEQQLKIISAQFHDALRLDSLEQPSDTREQNVFIATDGPQGQDLLEVQEDLISRQSTSDNSMGSFKPMEMSVNSVADTITSEKLASSGQKNILPPGKTSEITLLDERSLLTCIVRTIPAGGRIRISSTLPNRLSKMLAPLHWHDYKKKYGKLDDFVASHPELFVIEDDYIQLRDGAQEMIAATAAVAKVAAAAAISLPYSSILPSVAVTPVAQTQRPKRVPSVDSSQIRTDNPSQLMAIRGLHTNGVSFGGEGSLSNLKILSKHKELEVNGLDSTGQSSVHIAVGNGENINRSSASGAQRKGSVNGRFSSNFVVKQAGRSPGPASTSRRW